MSGIKITEYPSGNIEIRRDGLGHHDSWIVLDEEEQQEVLKSLMGQPDEAMVTTMAKSLCNELDDEYGPWSKAAEGTKETWRAAARNALIAIFGGGEQVE